jgi:hypothetical protein
MAAHVRAAAQAAQGRHEIVNLLAAMSPQLRHALQHEREYDLEAQRAALAAQRSRGADARGPARRRNRR